LSEAAAEAPDSDWEVGDGDSVEASPSITACSSLGEVTYPALLLPSIPLLLLPSSGEACSSGMLIAAGIMVKLPLGVWLISCILSRAINAFQFDSHL